MKGVHVYVSGRVQGVGYREATRKKAQSLGLVGWVKNLEDKRVELMAQGSKAAIDTLLLFLKSGPILAKVSQLDISEGVSLSDEMGFRIR